MAYNEPLIRAYYRHPSYDDYPVVGVSWEQVQEFCKWRSNRVNEMILMERGIFNPNVTEQADSESFDRCKELLDELLSFTVAHFRREEKMLEEFGYPNVEIHKKYHTELLARAKAVKSVCEALETKQNLKECCHEMFGFLVDDIVMGDLKFKSYLEDKGHITRPGT